MIIIIIHFQSVTVVQLILVKEDNLWLISPIKSHDETKNNLRRFGHAVFFMFLKTVLTVL